MADETPKSERDPELAILLAVNIAVFVFALTAQGNAMFMRLGLFPVYCLLFLTLALIRSSDRLRTADLAAGRILRVMIAAMLVMVAAQLFEPFAPHAGYSSEVVVLDTGGIYLAGQLLIILAMTRVLDRTGSEMRPLFRARSVATAAALAMAWAFLMIIIDPTGGKEGLTLTKEVGAALVTLGIGIYGAGAAGMLVRRLRSSRPFGTRLLIAYLLYASAAVSTVVEAVAGRSHRSWIPVIVDVRNLLFAAATAFVFVALGRAWDLRGERSDTVVEKPAE